MTRTLRLICAPVALALAVAACGSAATHNTTTSTASTATSTAASATGAAETHSTAGTQARPVSGHSTITIRNYMYLPMHLVVTAGTKVSFHNDDQTPHTATAINNRFDSGTINPGKTKTVTFTKAGTYDYHCLFHAFMTATITVVAAKA